MGKAHSMYGGREEMRTMVWWGNLMEREHLEDPGIEGRIILKLIFTRWDGRVWIGLMWLI